MACELSTSLCPPGVYPIPPGQRTRGYCPDGAFRKGRNSRTSLSSVDLHVEQGLSTCCMSTAELAREKEEVLLLSQHRRRRGR